MCACMCVCTGACTFSIRFCSIKLLRLVVNSHVHARTSMAVTQNDGEFPDTASDEEPQGSQALRCGTCGDAYEPRMVGTFLRFPLASCWGDRLPGYAVMRGISVGERLFKPAVDHAPGDTHGCGQRVAMHSHHLP